MEKIDFINNSTPALNATNLNKLQDNIEDALNEAAFGDQEVVVGNIRTKNMFNEASCQYGYYINNAGVLTAHSNYVVSGFIPVVPGGKYTYQGTSIDAGWGAKIGYYNSSKTYVSASDIVAGGTTITIPSGVYYLRTSIQKTEVSTYQFEEGETATPYTLGQNLNPTLDNLMVKTGAGVVNSSFTYGSCTYYKMGNLVILTISNLYGNTAAFEGTLATGVPSSSASSICIIYAYNNFAHARVRVTGNGEVVTHYSSIPASNQTQQFYGICIYTTND